MTTPFAAIQGAALAAALAAAAALGATVLDSGIRGPAVLVVGGTHGDEGSGVAAAKLLASGPAPISGTLVVLPEANPTAVAAGARCGPDGLDLNRIYPGRSHNADDNAPDGPTDRASSASSLLSRASAIFELARSCDLVIDLHEEGLAWSEADTQTFVFTPAASGLALDLVEALDEAGTSFAFTGGAPKGSLAGELGRLGQSAIVAEVPARLPLEARVSLHLALVEGALRILDMR